MSLSKEEIVLVNNLKTSGNSSITDIMKTLAKRRSGSLVMDTQTPEREEFKSSFIDSTFTSFGNAFEQGRKDITANVQETGQRIADVPDDALGTLVEKPALLLNSVFRAAGTTAKTAFSPVADALGAGIEKTSDYFSDIPSVQKFATNPHVEGALDAVTTGLIQAEDNYGEWKASNPQLAKDAEAGAEILFTVLGEKATSDIVARTTQLVRDSAKKFNNLGGIPPALPAPANGVSFSPFQIGGKTTVAKGGLGGGFFEGLSERASALSERIGTNISESRATEATIKELPKGTARTAARQGIDVNDIKQFKSFFDDPVTSETNTPLYKELADTAKAYSEAGQRGANPQAVVGKPVVEQFKALDKQRQKIGGELGAVADKLGNVTSKQVTPAVVAKLQKVNGLEGLQITKGGKLDFSNTSLATKLSAADQKAIQEAFTEAIASGSGKSKHLLRQELFEILGGKKMSGASVTGTQEKAFDAIRSGLSDVLESKNKTYKSLSNEYRKVIGPLTNARKLLRENKIAGEAGDNIDLLELRAGIIMRRLTGAGSSGPEIEALLRELDVVGRELGGSAVSTRNLQEFYNILNKYYDLSPPTGFQGQIKDALGSSGVLERIIKASTGTTAQTPAVRQKALENMLNELFNIK